MARPIQYLDTTVLVGTVEVEDEDDGTARRAFVDGFILVIDNEGTAVLSIPAGRQVTILTNAVAPATTNGARPPGGRGSGARSLGRGHQRPQPGVADM
ncbi:hypothetical protein [Streptomyces sp. NBC_01320]|uniref:hypothetical protein n=1 Tax=Streptomyces sp. NBC_01320 TaxID=2903824 RepID=UPI002E13CC3B|nr:hypothetical protein OG395_09250 [Streptomyces sp. NBC_01320]